MKKIYLVILVLVLTGSQSYSQCTFEALFPLKWGATKYMVNEYYQANPIYKPAPDTIKGSAFQHGLNYLFTVRDMDLKFYSYTNIDTHPCFTDGTLIMNCIATEEKGLVAYNYQVTFPATKRTEYLAVIESMKTMMEKKFTYQKRVETKTYALDDLGAPLTGEGVCFYFNDEPVVSSNLTYPQFVIRGGYLARKPIGDDKAVITNQAETIQYYRIEILYKMKKVE